MVDMVNHPPHYTVSNLTITLEPIQAVEELGFLMGSAFKYLFRFPYKGKPRQDLEKARWYLERYVAVHDNPLVNTKAKSIYLQHWQSLPWVKIYLEGKDPVDGANKLLDWISQQLLKENIYENNQYS